MPGFRLKLPQVQDELAERVRNELPEGLAFDIGYPDRGPASEHVWIDGAFDTDLTNDVSGGQVRDEDGKVRFVISITASRGPMTTLRDRALELEGCIEDAIADDPTLGDLVQQAWVSKVSGLYALPDKARTYYTTVDVSYAVAVSSSG